MFVKNRKLLNSIQKLSYVNYYFIATLALVSFYNCSISSHVLEMESNVEQNKSINISIPQSDSSRKCKICSEPTKLMALLI